MQRDCPRLKKALLYSIAHDIDTCHLSTRIMVYCLNRRLSKHYVCEWNQCWNFISNDVDDGVFMNLIKGIVAVHLSDDEGRVSFKLRANG
jgi:hypothetical protein